ncbi:uncharacterized protein EI90DRAFT_3053689 [Cantharellus anzutake]|uniref:uncharacterized protein n=1 Tax=Cantharellus anzutake TaxID=1750568 RepID=UPI001906B34B|nr:uncharacterized protein EI90DRAFT_3053689 [Cantharellus anzutake]KAF8332597.1 hypothetical protein EI90DRAFT_3053689 [Cantharellus anzutake]
MLAAPTAGAKRTFLSTALSRPSLSITAMTTAATVPRLRSKELQRGVLIELWDYVFGDVWRAQRLNPAVHHGSHTVRSAFSGSVEPFVTGTLGARPLRPRLKGWRQYSTQADPSSHPKEPSINVSSTLGATTRGSENGRSVWDNLIDDISLSDVAPLPVRRPTHFNKPVVGPMGRPAIRRQAMTREESNIFTELFDQIFASRKGRLNSSSVKKNDPLSGVGIGRKPGDMEPPSVHTLYGKLKRRSKRHHDVTNVDNIVERLRAEMDVIETDKALLDWAMEKVFTTNGLLPFTDKESWSKKNESETTISPSLTSPTSPLPKAPEADELTRISTYPHLLSTLIATFRDKFHDPHLSLSVFAYARRHSIHSYVFDVHGVVEALQEMKNNGVFPDNHTRNLAKRIRKEAMQTGLTTLGPETLDQPSIAANDPVLLLYLDRMDELIESEDVQPASLQDGQNVGMRSPEFKKGPYRGPRPRPTLYKMAEEDKLELV